MIDTVIHSDCLAALRAMPDNSVDAVVTDPPYGLGEVKDIAGLLTAWIRDEDDSVYVGKSGFMGKEWDAGVPSPVYWREVLRVLKPGAHMLCFAGTRTVDLMTISLRLAGFQCRDMLMWIHGQGFPKSLNLGNGRGTALKPAHEPIILVRKPLAEPSIAANVLAYGTGAINVDACRVGYANEQDYNSAKPGSFTYNDSQRNKSVPVIAETTMKKLEADKPTPHNLGRFPSHLLLSHSLFCTPQHEDASCPIAALDAQSGIRKSGGGDKHGRKPSTFCASTDWEAFKGTSVGGDTGGASRYFQCFPPMVDKDVTSLYNKGNNVEVNQWQKQTHGGTTANETIDTTESGENQEVVNNTPNLSIDGYGNSQTGQSLMDTKSTTSTTMQPTTDLKTSSLLPLNGTTTITNGSEKTTRSLMELSIDGVESANNTNLLTNSTLDEQEPITDTASHAIGNSSENGVIRTENATISTDANTTTPTKATLEPGYENNKRYFTNFPPSLDAPLDAPAFVPFLYQSKASRRERNQGCEDLPLHDARVVHNQNCKQCIECDRIGSNSDKVCPRCGGALKIIEVANPPRTNHHPTVKPIKLMQWLVRLITPPGGIVLDPFAGSGSTLCAAVYEGVHFIGIEQDESYVNIARARIAHAREHPPQEVKVATKKVKGGNNKTRQRVTPHAGGNGKTMNGGWNGEITEIGYADQDGLEEVEAWDCDESCPIRILGEQSGERKSGLKTSKHADNRTGMFSLPSGNACYSEQTGNASRYFQHFPPDSLFASCEEEASA